MDKYLNSIVQLLKGVTFLRREEGFNFSVDARTRILNSAVTNVNEQVLIKKDMGEQIQLEEVQEQIDRLLLVVNGMWLPPFLIEEFKRGKLVIERYFEIQRMTTTRRYVSGIWEKHIQLENLLLKRSGTSPPSVLVEDSREGFGHFIGKLFVSRSVIAEGSNMTIIFEGIYDCEIHIAIKRVVQRRNVVNLYNLAMLIKLVRHRNIVRVLDIGIDEDYIYFALERCSCNLYELMQLWSNNMNWSNARVPRIVKKLWKFNGYPSPKLLKLIRDVVTGLAHLHDLGFVNRDLKPQNVLISCEESVRAKICDQGIIEGIGEARRRSPGWHSPELLLGGTKGSPEWNSSWLPSEESEMHAADLFNLGCVIFYFITKGGHPFGSDLERDANIVENRPDLTLVKHIYEAAHLISNLLHPQPKMRPQAAEVLCHPFFWDSEKRGLFLRDVSEWLEHDDSMRNYVVNAIMDAAPKVLTGNWDVKMEAGFLTYASHHKYYSYDSVLDLLLLIGNTLSYQPRLPKDIQVLIGSTNGEIYNYFARRFPNLLTEVYDVISKCCEFFRITVNLNQYKLYGKEKKAVLMYLLE
ncbi:serine/threonine-protein kinase/endoribonuclease IRE1a [Cinnamomum micranthum f. kanehirae]|uniref:Serine/threonine-protein kinase/endoribonuclease IRE1a n=1 Tax=Cinnamomum micranthum f. kanehirae TaxID=337451 RepID=A0A443PUI3_9MAGN|nr:serine/threonine-protein kinase/endoribonuclease IRE1a [Cinnamomum micranthum f. kanehirae]